MSPDEILSFQRLVRKVPAADAVTRYAVRLVGASRPASAEAPDFIKRWVTWGGSLRASHSWFSGARRAQFFMDATTYRSRIFGQLPRRCFGIGYSSIPGRVREGRHRSGDRKIDRSSSRTQIGPRITDYVETREVRRAIRGRPIENRRRARDEHRPDSLRRTSLRASVRSSFSRVPWWKDSYPAFIARLTPAFPRSLPSIGNNAG